MWLKVWIREPFHKFRGIVRSPYWLPPGLHSRKLLIYTCFFVYTCKIIAYMIWVKRWTFWVLQKNRVTCLMSLLCCSLLLYLQVHAHDLILYYCWVQVILKIIKHCKEFSPALVTGQLLGLDVGSVLEVTNCFPFPVCEYVHLLSSTISTDPSSIFLILKWCYILHFCFSFLIIPLCWICVPWNYADSRRRRGDRSRWC